MLPAAAFLLALACATAADSSKIEYIDVESPALHRAGQAGVYLPPGYERGEDRYPVVYFLHGMRGSERQWEARGMGELLDGLIRAGEVPPMIVVAPAGENSMYVNWKSGEADWADFIAKDLVAVIDARYRTRAEPAFRGISGDSMGGYGALNVGFQQPDVFGSISAHSAALYPVDPDALPDWIKQRGERWGDIFGFPVDADHWRNNNPLHLATTLPVADLRRLQIYFDCGRDDRYGFDTGNAELDAVLAEREVPHVFHLRTGNHGREYFSKYAPESLRFHGAVFRAAAGGAERPNGADEQDAAEGDREV